MTFSSANDDADGAAGDDGHFLMALVDAAPVAMILIDRISQQMVFVNSECEQLFGYGRSELIGQPIDFLVPVASRGSHGNLMRSYCNAPTARSMGAGRHLHALRKDGTGVPVEIALKPFDTKEGVFVLAVVVDISERKRLEAAVRRANEELERRVTQRTLELARINDEKEVLLAGLQAQRSSLELLSREDSLTGLSNRRAYEMDLREEIEKASRSRSPLAAAMLDIDRFKTVNDRFGHALGDTVLRESARILRENCRSTDRISRYGGEEFAIAMPGTEMRTAFALCERIRGTFEQFAWNSLAPDLKVTISAGIAAWSAGADADELMAMADSSLYEAKRNGRNRTVMKQDS